MPKDTIYISGGETVILPSGASQVYFDKDGNLLLVDKKEEGPSPFEYFMFWALFIFLIGVAIKAIAGAGRGFMRSSASKTNKVNPVSTESSPDRLVYAGSELAFSDLEIDRILKKHFPYYNSLNNRNMERFVYRLQRFMAAKYFVIHASQGFKEMPVLLSASAVKLSFGLTNYMLPFYKAIHIFPDAFIGVSPSLRVLAGNVSGNSIHVSWKHFLEGIKDATDGSNLGLHEMAHAYYFQNFETGRVEDEHFVKNFAHFNQFGDKVFELEKNGLQQFYSEYAMTNFQEFWAESVELFFEKPVVFKQTYPQLYNIISKLLNQDTASMV